MFASFRSSTEYKALPSSPPPLEVADDNARPSGPVASCSIVMALIICLTCTVINIVLSVPNTFVTPAIPTISSITRADMHRLRRPSQFIGFDKIERPFPPVPKQFNNYPILLAQIDEGDKGRVFEDDPKRYLSSIGTISPEDRRVLVTNQISTVVQFRAVDYGMEICELHIVLAEDIVPSANLLTLSLFRLNVSVPVDVHTLNYANRPSKVAKLADIAIQPGTALHWHRKFTCAMEELLTFELKCSPVGEKATCEAEWWQNKEDPVSAVYLIQHATV